jgi:hypothetical protein
MTNKFGLIFSSSNIEELLVFFNDFRTNFLTKFINFPKFWHILLALRGKLLTFSVIVSLLKK